MDINRSGYYKWKSRQGLKNRYEQDRECLTRLLIDVHKKHRSYGYHRLATIVRSETGWLFTDNLAHKCCKFAGIKSRTNHYQWRKPRGEHETYKNLVAGKWNATRPLEIVSSDMTIIHHKGKSYEWTYILDTFNNEIISSHIGHTRGDSTPYFLCLDDLKKKVKEQKEPIIFHTDQGSIYSSIAFNYALDKYNIKRSMSRAATPTDNAIIESINGWIKAEMFSEGWHRCFDTPEEMVNAFVEYYNNERPAYALQYKTPIQYKTELGFL